MFWFLYYLRAYYIIGRYYIIGSYKANYECLFLFFLSPLATDNCSSRGNAHSIPDNNVRIRLLTSHAQPLCFLGSLCIHWS